MITGTRENIKKLFSRFNCNWKLLCLSLLGIGILAFGLFRSSRAFEYKTDSADSTDYYTISDGEELTQLIGSSEDTLNGVTVKIGTFQNVVEGLITVTLNEDGSPIRKASLEAEYLVDNAYQKFYFNKPAELKPDRQYSFSFSYEYAGEDDAIALYTSRGGCVESSSGNVLNSSLVYQLIFVNNHLRNIFVGVFCLLFVCSFGVYIKYTDYEQESVSKILLIALLIIIGIEVLSTDLMPSIQRNVALTSPTDSETVITIEPGNIYETTFEADYASFNRLEIYPKDYGALNLRVSLTDEDSGEIYVESSYSEEHLITDSVTGRNALMLSTEGNGKKMPVGNYKISIKNDGVETVSLSSVENENDITLNSSQIQYTWKGYWIFLVIAVVLVAFLTCILVNIKRKVSVEKYFLMLVIPLSIIYFILFQAWNMPDTYAHFEATYRLSNILLGFKADDAWYIRADDYKYFSNVWGNTTSNPSMKALLGTLSEVGFTNGIFVQDAKMIQWPDPSTRMEYYSIFSYLPEVLGFTVARLLHLGTVPMTCLGRAFMLIAYIGCMYHAIKTSPVGKYVFMIFSLLPMTLMMSAAISYDGMVIIATTCFCATVLRLYKEQENKKCLIECACWAFVIGGVKGGGYLVLLPIALILVDKNWKKSLKLILPILIAGLVSVLLFDVFLPSDELFQFGEEASGKLSATWGWQHPVEFFDMVVRTYLRYIDTLTINMGGTSLAWLEGTLPSVIVIGLMLVGGCGAIFEIDELKLKKKDRNIFLLVIFLEFYFTPIMLLSWTPVGYTWIEGLQGRYFMPVLPLIIMVFTKFLMNGAIKTEDGGLIAIRKRCDTLIVLLSLTAVYIMSRLYLTR